GGQPEQLGRVGDPLDRADVATLADLARDAMEHRDLLGEDVDFLQLAAHGDLSLRPETPRTMRAVLLNPPPARPRSPPRPPAAPPPHGRQATPRGRRSG